jgi:hypothetical protein
MPPPQQLFVHGRTSARQDRGKKQQQQQQQATHSKKALGTWNVSTSCASWTTGACGLTSPSDMVGLERAAKRGEGRGEEEVREKEREKGESN